MRLAGALNPVLARELRARARRKSVPILLSVFLLVLVGIAATVSWTTVGDVDEEATVLGANQYNQLTTLGRNMFEWTVTALFGLICFMVPGFTAASISGERDRQTLIPMQVTLLRPRQIVLGKMLSSSSYTLFLIAMSIPVVALGYAIGGVERGEVIRAIIGLLFVATIWAFFSIFASALVRRTAPAVVLAYAIMLLFLIVVLIVAAVAENQAMLAANPFVIFADFVTPSGNRLDFFGASGPISATAAGFNDESPSYWVRGVIGFSVLMALSFLFATRRVRTPAVTER
jgi:ABC-2 type transport system permease protein